MSSEKWTKANRITEIVKHTVRREIVGSDFGPSVEMIKGYFDGSVSKLVKGDEVWALWVETQTGLDKRGFGITYYETKDDVDRAIAGSPLGTRYGEKADFPLKFKEIIGGPDPVYALRMLFGCGDDDEAHGICYDALVGAGVKSKATFGISDRVIEWAGTEHIAFLKEAFGENWSAVLALEYCFEHYPPSSLVTLSAKLFVAYFITHDDFTVGYLTKEIQAIAGGTEQMASASVKTRHKAGKGGAKSSSGKKRERLSVFMEEIEKLSGVVSVMSEERILSEAFERAAKERPDMPKTPKIQFEYAVALRSSEPFKSRYQKVFSKHA